MVTMVTIMVVMDTELVVVGTVVTDIQIIILIQCRLLHTIILGLTMIITQLVHMDLIQVLICTRLGTDTNIKKSPIGDFLLSV